MILGISGQAGVGKDTFADELVRSCGFVKIALADPMKRFCAQVFGFSAETLWGPSEKRNEEHAHLGGLTARHALQQLGTEWGRSCGEDTWIRYGLRVAKTLLLPTLDGDCPWRYSPEIGLYQGAEFQPAVRGVVFTDIRFVNELTAIRIAGGTAIRIRRDTARLLDGAAGLHKSEQEQQGIPDSAFDHVLENVGSKESLQLIARRLFDVLPSRH